MATSANAARDQDNSVMFRRKKYSTISPTSIAHHVRIRPSRSRAGQTTSATMGTILRMLELIAGSYSRFLGVPNVF